MSGIAPSTAPILYGTITRGVVKSVLAAGWPSIIPS